MVCFIISNQSRLFVILVMSSLSLPTLKRVLIRSPTPLLILPRKVSIYEFVTDICLVCWYYLCMLQLNPIQLLYRYYAYHHGSEFYLSLFLKLTESRRLLASCKFDSFLTIAFSSHCIYLHREIIPLDFQPSVAWHLSRPRTLVSSTLTVTPTSKRRTSMSVCIPHPTSMPRIYPMSTPRILFRSVSGGGRYPVLPCPT